MQLPVDSYWVWAKEKSRNWFQCSPLIYCSLFRSVFLVIIKQFVRLIEWNGVIVLKVSEKVQKQPLAFSLNIRVFDRPQRSETPGIEGVFQRRAAITPNTEHSSILHSLWKRFLSEINFHYCLLSWQRIRKRHSQQEGTQDAHLS